MTPRPPTPIPFPYTTLFRSYLYGHGGPGIDSLNAVFEVQTGRNNYGTQATTTGSEWTSPDWEGGRLYAGYTVFSFSVRCWKKRIISLPGSSGWAVRD